MSTEQAEVVIVGAGLAGSIVAYQLAMAGVEVLVLESGPEIPVNRAQYLERFYTTTLKTPESPYPPVTSLDPPRDPAGQNAPRATIADLILGWDNPAVSYLVQKGPMPFTSTYERVGGGTTWHWVGTSLRMVPNDFRLKSLYNVGVDWPIGYDDLQSAYCRAEAEIGVSANVADQAYLGITFPEGYAFPMHSIPLSLVDGSFVTAVTGQSFDGLPLVVSPTPAGRNSEPYAGRRVCAGNTNCTPICPIQAKYDATVTMTKALATGKVKVLYRTVASKVTVGADNNVSGVEFMQYQLGDGPVTGTGVALGQRYVIAAHAIETPKLLLNSATPAWPKGVANSSGQVGRSLADHPIYLAWGLMPEGKAIFPYRGPLSTAGIESLRDGAFRSQRAAWRIEIGNEGWNWPANDPYDTVADFIDGTNNNRVNPLSSNQDPKAPTEALYGTALVQKLNDIFVRQFRIAFLVEQVEDDPDNAKCYIVPSADFKDRLGIPRPEIHYELSEYTKKGFLEAKRLATHIIKDLLGAEELTKPLKPGKFIYDKEPLSFQGAGHLMGTYRMGSDPATSVVDKDQRSWDHKNLFLVGDGVFPSSGTSNPSLTIAALSFQAGDTLANDLKAAAAVVVADKGWQGTGVQIDGVVPRRARWILGFWNASPDSGWVDGKGNPNYTAKSGYTLPGAAEGALIGRVGDSGTPFLIGDLAQIPAGQSGELQLCINDDLMGRYGAGLSDNQGALTVGVEFGTV
ncbi:GMC family oxidoreductase [Pseudomonas corrugata]|uniref:Glucose-methanol-choline oxidoreductase C-terminal domain-containing protein n=1 Tax=Pseudomonas corrugata TaxID=47879 RepID=A0A3M3E2Y0_9PSED|nr:GMC family oxidoreductase [Pseudomonas corrugata]AOE63235.1 dehydrogenase [Pseudomonas corrugata]MDU9024382.1 GMC family oxidoreductase [Pseudomonas corrugata]MDU9036476.1 GMC family oxidoreductase [Pseudomonas corrugata]MDU9042645.1 GMC family oxidoreductase [Pseudomonas corrugata]QTH14489.1 GMC family oxidoreductase [Pseudomonas corrugata]